MSDRYISDYEKIRYRDESGQRVIWSSQSGIDTHVEELGNHHLVSIWHYVMRKNPLEPKLTYIAQEIKFRNLEAMINEEAIAKEKRRAAKAEERKLKLAEKKKLADSKKVTKRKPNVKKK